MAATSNSSANVASLSSAAAPTTSASSAKAVAASSTVATVAPTTAQSTSARATTSAPAASSASVKPAAAGVKITWWSGWGSGGLAAKSFDVVAGAANKADLGFQVEHTVPPGDVAKKLTVAIAAGTPPDVEAGNLSYPEFWASGQAIALDSYLAKSQTLKKSDLLAASWTFGSYQGHTYGVPALESFVRWGLVVNADLLAKRGLDGAALPNNWSDLLDWHKKLTVVDPASKAITQLGIDPLDAMGGSMSGGDPFFWGPSSGLGTGYYDEKAAKFNLVNSQLEDALAAIKSFYDAAGGYAAVQTFRKTNGEWTGAKSGIVMGTQAMQINSYWTIGSVTQLAPTKRYVYGWPPTSPDRKGKKIQSTGGHFAVLPKGSPFPDQAFAFAEYLTSEAVEQIIFDGPGWLGARKSFLAKVDVKQHPGLDFFIQSATTADELWGDPVDPIEGFFADTWAAQAVKVFQGTQTPQDALQQMQQLSTVQLAKQLGK